MATMATQFTANPDAGAGFSTAAAPQDAGFTVPNFMPGLDFASPGAPAGGEAMLATSPMATSGKFSHKRKRPPSTGSLVPSTEKALDLAPITGTKRQLERWETTLGELTPPELHLQGPTHTTAQIPHVATSSSQGHTHTAPSSSNPASVQQAPPLSTARPHMLPDHASRASPAVPTTAAHPALSPAPSPTLAPTSPADPVPFQPAPPTMPFSSKQALAHPHRHHQPLRSTPKQQPLPAQQQQQQQPPQHTQLQQHQKTQIQHRQQQQPRPEPKLILLPSVLEPPVSPATFMSRILDAHLYEHEPISALSSDHFHHKPTAEQVAAYSMDLVRAVRDSNIPQILQFRDSGHQLDACNRFGESVMHMACRRNSPEVVKLLLDEQLRVNRCDDFGRTPLHDACWSDKPGTQVAELLLNQDRSLVVVCDGRKSLPLSYVHRDHWGAWCNFLNAHKHHWWHPADVNEWDERLAKRRHGVAAPSDTSNQATATPNASSIASMTAGEATFIVHASGQAVSGLRQNTNASKQNLTASPRIVSTVRGLTLTAGGGIKAKQHAAAMSAQPHALPQPRNTFPPAHRDAFSAETAAALLAHTGDSAPELVSSGLPYDDGYNPPLDLMVMSPVVDATRRSLGVASAASVAPTPSSNTSEKVFADGAMMFPPAPPESTLSEVPRA